MKRRIVLTLPSTVLVACTVYLPAATAPAPAPAPVEKRTGTYHAPVTPAPAYYVPAYSSQPPASAAAPDTAAAPAPVSGGSTGGEGVQADCKYKGIALYGNVKIVDSFPDIEVKIVNSFADLHVKVVDSFPDQCGRWKIVDSFPDFTVKYVDSFPDIEVKFVDSFPGLP